MGAICGVTSYILRPDEWAHFGAAEEEDVHRPGLAGFARRPETVVIEPSKAFTVMGLRGEIFDALDDGKAGKRVQLTLSSGSTIGVAFASEAMSHVVTRSAQAFAKAVLPTIGVTTARTLTIPLAPFFKRSSLIGNPLQSIEAPMRAANMKSDRQIMFQVYAKSISDHPDEVFYYDMRAVSLRQVFRDLCEEGLVRQGPTAWREHTHPRRGFAFNPFRRKAKGGVVGF